MPEASPRSKTRDNHRKISVVSQDSETRRNVELNEPQLEATNSTEKVSTFFIWSIFNLLFVPFGIACCYFSHTVSQFKMQNRFEMAKKWSKRTFVLNLITTLMMIGLIITIVMLRNDIVQRNSDFQVNQTRTTGAFIPWQPGR